LGVGQSLDATGGTTGVSDYDAWGNVRTATGSQGLFGWTGEPRDAVTGLTYLRARDYSPGTGRFVQRDTVSPNGPGTQGFNPYAYVAGNPTTFTDPSGHYPSAEVIVHIFIAFDFTALSAISASYGIQFLIVESAIAGAVVTPAGPNYWAAFVLFTVAALMFAFALMAQQIAYCLHYGVVCGGTVDVSGLAQILSGTIGSAYLTGTATRTATCKLAFQNSNPLQFVLNIVRLCPVGPGDKPPDDDNCEELINEPPDDFGPPGNEDQGGDSGSLTNSVPPIASGSGPTSPSGPPGSPQPPQGSNPPPGEGWSWRGSGPPGSDQGNWVNDKTGARWHPHNDPSGHGPHYDYIDENGNRWRYYPDQDHWEPQG
jgi:RHS repeat-associated protein